MYRGQLHKTLGLPDKIPATFSGRFPNTPVYDFWQYWILAQGGDSEPLEVLTIVVKAVDKKVLDSLRRKKSSKHRVFFECHCGKLVPCGRYSQHRKACKKP